MSRWKILTNPSEKQWFSYEEQKFWINNAKSICCSTGYRYATFEVNTTDDSIPKFAIKPVPYNVELNGINLNDHVNNVNNTRLLEKGEDWFCEWHFPDNMPFDDCELIEEGWDKNGTDFLRDNGWVESTINAWLFGSVQFIDETDHQITVINTTKENI